VRGLAPLWIGLATFALAMAVWLLVLEPRLPLPLRRRPHPPGQLGWYVDGRIPLYLKGEASADGWLAVGDSRVNHGIDEEHLEREGIRPLAVLWVGGAQLEDLLAAARELPPRRLIVVLSPLEIHRVILNAEREREQALEFMERSWTRRIDGALADRFVRLRSSLVNFLDTRGLAAGWLEQPYPEATDERQAAALGPPTRPDRAAALVRIEDALRGLIADGRRIVCVRMPISPSLRAVEDEAFDPKLFEELCARLALPYLDLGTSEPTIDGSHLTAEGGRHLAPRLAQFLKSQP